MGRTAPELEKQLRALKGTHTVVKKREFYIVISQSQK